MNLERASPRLEPDKWPPRKFIPLLSFSLSRRKFKLKLTMDCNFLNSNGEEVSTMGKGFNDERDLVEDLHLAPPNGKSPNENSTAWNNMQKNLLDSFNEDRGLNVEKCKESRNSNPYLGHINSTNELLNKNLNDYLS